MKSRMNNKQKSSSDLNDIYQLHNDRGLVGSVDEGGVEPPPLAGHASETCAYANSATRPLNSFPL